MYRYFKKIVRGYCNFCNNPQGVFGDNGGGIAEQKRKVKNMEKIKWSLSSVLGVVTAFIGHYGIMITLVTVAIMFDFVTGVVKAKIHGTLSSTVGTKGFLKKIALLIGLFFGFFLDYMIPYMCHHISINIPFNTPFGLIICFYIVLNESISVCENLYACDPKILPKWIVNILRVAKKKIEDGADNEDTEKE